MKNVLRILALFLMVLGMAVLTSCKDGSASDPGNSSPTSPSVSPSTEETESQLSFGSIGDIPEVDW